MQYAIMQLLHLWILSAFGVVQLPVRFSQRPDSGKEYTNSGNDTLTGSCRAALALGPEGTNCWVPHGGKAIRVPTTNTFVKTSQSRLGRGMKINELYITRAKNYLVMDVQTVSKPYATGTCRVQTVQLLVAEAHGWYVRVSVG